jgi:hypothetical protein
VRYIRHSPRIRSARAYHLVSKQVKIKVSYICIPNSFNTTEKKQYDMESEEKLLKAKIAVALQAAEETRAARNLLTNTYAHRLRPGLNP